MRFAVYEVKGRRGLAVERDGACSGLFVDEAGYPGDLDVLIADGADFSTAGQTLANGKAVDLNAVHLLPPLSHPNKIVCVGLNYREHSAETGFEEQTYPTIFTRFTTSLIGHLDPIILPPQSSQ